MAGINDLLFGSQNRVKQVSTLNNQQNDFLNNDIFGQLKQMMGQGGAYSGAQGFLQKILQGGPEAFAQFEAPYKQQFEQQILPNIAERFAGANAMGSGLSSSGFGQALGGAGAQLQAQLAGLHGGLQQGASQQAFGQFNQLSNQGLGTRAFENLYQPQTQGGIGDITALLTKLLPLFL
jgi:hypothetical protein